MPLYCKTAHPADNKPRSFKSVTSIYKTCTDFGRSTALTGWLADGVFLWDRAAVRGIGQKESKDLSLQIGFKS